MVCGSSVFGGEAAGAHILRALGVLPGGEASNPRLQYEHGVAEGVEPVSLFNGLPVCGEDALAAGKCRYQHHQGRAGEVEVGEHGAHQAKLVARKDEQIRVPRGGLDLLAGISRHVFQGSNRGGADGDDAMA